MQSGQFTNAVDFWLIEDGTEETGGSVTASAVRHVCVSKDVPCPPRPITFTSPAPAQERATPNAPLCGVPHRPVHTSSTSHPGYDFPDNSQLGLPEPVRVRESIRGKGSGARGTKWTSRLFLSQYGHCGIGGPLMVRPSGSLSGRPCPASAFCAWTKMTPWPLARILPFVPPKMTPQYGALGFSHGATLGAISCGPAPKETSAHYPFKGAHIASLRLKLGLSASKTAPPGWVRGGRSCNPSRSSPQPPHMCERVLRLLELPSPVVTSEAGP